MLLHEELTSKILRCFYNVYNKLGYGFLEKVYENALLIELQKNGLQALQQKPIKVYYENVQVGSYYADILVEDMCILELKAGEGGIIMEHELQLLNYLKATDYEIGLLLFFGEKPSFKRKVFTNENKQIR
ncbi:GxxExxY protein [Lacibacter cauensis]|uniref:GxxExxY protein n=1 Tax=Lacibacter cauensis TaxID=510947 RepID=A0A562SWA4_9BACT|nr:GxxExxY protein [Lacibacter cauensis]TWI85453.1 GxxExxY protein [Lacibacter cauensis]